MIVVMRSPSSSGKQVDQRLAARGGGRQRQLPHLHLVGHAARGEEQDGRVGVGDEELRHEVGVAHRHAGAALAAAALGAVGGERHALDVAGMGDRHHHVLALDQVLGLELAFLLDDLGAPRGGEVGLDLGELVLDDALHAGARAQDRQVVLDLAAELFELRADLVAPERGEALQAQVEDGAGLLFGQAVAAVLVQPVARVGDEHDERRHVVGRPVAAHEFRARRRGIGGGADEADDLGDIGDRDRHADQHVGPVARLVEQELGALGDDFFAERDEGGDEVVQGHDLGAAAGEGDRVDAEGRLQLRVAVELVEDDLGDRVALEFDDDAHAVAVGLVADVGNALDALVAHGLGDALHHRGLVHLIGDLGDDERLALAPDLLHGDPAAHQDRAAPGVVGRADAGMAEDEAAGGEIGPGHDLDQLVDGDVGIVDEGDAGVDDLAEVVGGHVGGHADGDAAGAVDQQVGKARRQDDGLVLGIVVVGLEVDGVLVDVVEQRMRGAGEAHFRVSHGRRGVAVDGAEVALAVDQRQAQRIGLRHAHQRVVDRLVAVRVILTDDVADDAGRLAVGLVPVVAVLVHGEQDAPVHGLQAVAHVGQGARHDHAHGVVEVGALHLLLDGDRADVFRLAAGLIGVAGAQAGVPFPGGARIRAAGLVFIGRRAGCRTVDSLGLTT
jgi:hypothetical protein